MVYGVRCTVNSVRLGWARLTAEVEELDFDLKNASEYLKNALEYLKNVLEYLKKCLGIPEKCFGIPEKTRPSHPFQPFSREIRIPPRFLSRFLVFFGPSNRKTLFFSTKNAAGHRSYFLVC